MKNLLIIFTLIIFGSFSAHAGSYICDYQVQMYKNNNQVNNDLSLKNRITINQQYTKIELIGAETRKHYELTLSIYDDLVDVILVDGYPESVWGARIISNGGIENSSVKDKFSVYGLSSEALIKFECKAL